MSTTREKQRSFVADVPILSIAGHRLTVSELTEFGFKFPSVDLSCEGDRNNILTGQFEHDSGIELPVRFVVRRTANGVAHGGFKDQTLAERKQLVSFIKAVGTPTTDVLSTMTYDELAEGKVTREVEPPHTLRPPKETTNKFKSLVAMLMALGMVAILVTVVASVRMRYSVKIVNAVMVGNCLPVNTPTDGEVAELLVTEGQEVRKGDVLLRIRNEEFENQHALLGSALKAARQEVIAIERMVDDHKHKVQLAKKRIEFDVAVAKADLRKAQSQLKAASSKVHRLSPLFERNNISLAEYDEAVSIKDAALAECEARGTAIQSLAIAKTAADSDMLFLGDRIDDRPSELRAQLDIATARVEQLTRDLCSSEKRARHIEIEAPRDGSIYAVYRQHGEFLKVGEEALAMSFKDGGWASGHVPADQATKIRPGQSVELIIPSLDMKTEGIVAAVGHRAVYGKGGYSSDYRGPTPNHVPIKVQVHDLSGEIPSGLRLNMIVQLENNWEWLNDINIQTGMAWLKDLLPEAEESVQKPEETTDTTVATEPQLVVSN